MLLGQKLKTFNPLLIFGMIVSIVGVFIALSIEQVNATPRCYFGGVQDQEVSCPPNLNQNTCYSIDGNQNVSTMSCFQADSVTGTAPDDGLGVGISGPPSGFLFDRIKAIIRFLSIGVGVLLTIMVAVSGIQWIASGGNPQSRAAAVGRLTSAGIGLMLFVFGYALLNWLVPGGL